MTSLYTQHRSRVEEDAIPTSVKKQTQQLWKVMYFRWGVGALEQVACLKDHPSSCNGTTNDLFVQQIDLNP